MDEPAAIAAAWEFATRNGPVDAMSAVEATKLAGDLYANAKHALNRWCRRVAVKPDWAGARIPLNVVAPGFIDTPAAAYILSNSETSAAMRQMVPMRGAYPARPEEMAAILAWCVSAENSLMTGQILFVDGGAEPLLRGEKSW